MPRIVDHDARRSELAAATWRVIVRSGLDAVTTREIAREAGYSTGVLAHYFKSKDDILLAALTSSHEQIKKRFQQILATRDGLAALGDYLFDNLPLTQQQQLETYLEISFWSRALANDALREVQRKESAELRETVQQLLVTAEKRGELAPGDASARAELLLALVDGLSLHALLYPERLSAERTRQLMEAQLDQWRSEDGDRRVELAGLPASFQRRTASDQHSPVE